MKRYIFLLPLVFFGLGAHAQTTADFDQRLLAKYSQQQIEDLQKEQPQIIAYWTYYLDHAYTIEDVYTAKEVPFSGTLKIKDLQTFNILESGAVMNRNSATFYRIKGSNKMLVMQSGNNITKAFNAAYIKN